MPAEAELTGDVIHELKISGFLPTQHLRNPYGNQIGLLGTMDELEEAGDEMDMKF